MEKNILYEVLSFMVNSVQNRQLWSARQTGVCRTAQEPLRNAATDSINTSRSLHWLVVWLVSLNFLNTYVIVDGQQLIEGALGLGFLYIKSSPSHT